MFEDIPNFSPKEITVDFEMGGYKRIIKSLAVYIFFSSLSEFVA
jgi:hypothetical protein